jgi:hypothetical protein
MYLNTGTMKHIYTLLFLLIAFKSFADYTTPNTNQKWTLDDLVSNSAGNVTFSGGEYAVNGIITISTTDTLSIATDAIVKFAVSTHFLVNGTITVNPPNSVVFTAQDQALGFNGVRLDFSVASSFKKFTLEYAVSLNLRDCSPPIDSCIFQYNNNNASTSFGNGAISLFRSSPVITNSKFLNNKRAAIQGGANIANAPKVINSVFMGNNTTNQNVPQINLGGSGTDTTKIINNQFLASSTNSGGLGFLPTVNLNVLITGNIIKNNRYGISLQGGSLINSLVSYNVIDSNNTQNNPALGGSGIAFAGGSASSHQNSIVTGNYIRGNLWGITIQNYAQPNLGNLGNADTADDGKNVITGNTNTSTPGIELYNNSPDNIFAQGNRWGSDDPAVIESRIFHQPDNATLGLVNYSSYVVLPVQLTAFSGVMTGGTAVLTWHTSSESNSAHFEIQRSTDGRQFNRIGQVAAAGYSNSGSSYTYNDEPGGNQVIYYYRIRMVDKNGDSRYSAVVALRNADAVTGVRMFPSVLSGDHCLSLEMTTTKAQKLTITFYNGAGQLISQMEKQAVPGTNIYSIDVSRLPSGLIVARITGEGFSRVMRLVKS